MTDDIDEIAEAGDVTPEDPDAPDEVKTGDVSPEDDPAVDHEVPA